MHNTPPSSGWRVLREGRHAVSFKAIPAWRFFTGLHPCVSRVWLFAAWFRVAGTLRPGRARVEETLPPLSRDATTLTARPTWGGKLLINRSGSVAEASRAYNYAQFGVTFTAPRHNTLLKQMRLFTTPAKPRLRANTQAVPNLKEAIQGGRWLCRFSNCKQPGAAGQGQLQRVMSSHVRVEAQRYQAAALTRGTPTVPGESMACDVGTEAAL